MAKHPHQFEVQNAFRTARSLGKFRAAVTGELDRIIIDSAVANAGGPDAEFGIFINDTLVETLPLATGETRIDEAVSHAVTEFDAFEVKLLNTLPSLITVGGPLAVQLVVDDGAETQGPAGDDGSDGLSVRSGSGVPSNSLGVDGDSYLDTATGDVYVKASGAYTVSGNIKGADGNDGNDGTNGTNGLSVRAGSGAPSNGLGVNGDSYLDTATGDVYVKSGGTYTVSGNIKGTTGATGAGVPTGGTTGQVLKKNSGTNYDTSWADQSSGGAGTLGALRATTHAEDDEFGASSLDAKWTKTSTGLAVESFDDLVRSAYYWQINPSGQIKLSQTYAPGSSDFSLTFAFNVQMRENYNQALIIVSDTAGNNDIELGLTYSSAVIGFFAHKRVAGVQTFDIRSQVTLTPPIWPVVYIHVERISGQWYSYYSMDAFNWTLFLNNYTNSFTVGKIHLIGDTASGATKSMRGAFHFLCRDWFRI